jgi:glycosyltransferase involved in cell wall biosynthesis
MKILQTCLSRSWGGMEMYTLQTSLLLKNAGHQVELLCAGNSRLAVEADKAGIKTITFSKSVFHVKNILSLISALKTNNYDIIHAEASKDLWAIVPALLLSMKKTPLLLTKHIGSNIVKKDYFHKLLYNRVDLALAISEVIKNNLVETTPLNQDKIQLLHDAIDADKFNPNNVDHRKVRREFGIQPDEILIGMTGRFSPGKGHEEFLAAAKELLIKHPRLRFMIVGEASRGEEAYARSIRQMAVDLGINEKIIFTGFRKDIPEILAALDIYLFPSHAEAFGLALVEAMSMELPTVCSNSDGVLDIAIEGVTSFLFSTGSEDDLLKKVDYLIKNPTKRKELGKEGRKRVLANFNTDLFTRKLVNIYTRQISNTEPESGKAA